MVKAIMMKKLLKAFLVSCAVGTIGEGVAGWIIRALTGHFLWIYPESPLTTTSLIVIPLWGIVGLMFYFTFKRAGVSA